MDEREKHICWVNPAEKVVSFRREEGYLKTEFASRKELLEFVRLRVDLGYKVQ